MLPEDLLPLFLGKPLCAGDMSFSQTSHVAHWHARQTSEASVEALAEGESHGKDGPSGLQIRRSLLRLGPS